ncbi:MAG TPA: 4-hydroxy-3-methylbut-2-enyl diphosphate reductase [Phycisphaerales bacterium]|nr:4-hydroxy-3-methylbut-2-enyl diphosphate reductase [Phycisphaerales bacterium]
MRLILTNPRGFCAGVHMAIDVVDQVLDLYPGKSIYVFHEIVHNKHVVDRFKERGVAFVEEVSEVPEGSIIVFSAHGISPAVRAEAKARNLTTVDATCPLVTKVHNEAIRYARQGYDILLVGHADHQEVQGTRGEAPESIQVVECPEDIPHLRIRNPDKVAYLTQTTLSTDDAEVIIQALKKTFPKIKDPPSSDICYATTNRQHAVRQIAPEVDVVLVVGSRNSSNSVRLTEISANVGTRAYLLDDAGELRDEWFAHVEGGAAKATILITAGASAPEDLVAELCRTLIARYNNGSPPAIEQRDIFREDEEFGLPASLKRLMREEGRGSDVDQRKIKVGSYDLTEELYGAVPLTIAGRAIE